VALAAAACGGSAAGALATSSSGAGATGSTGRPAGSPTASTAPDPIESSPGIAPAVDPCQLVPADEASTLAGTSFTAGSERSAQAAKQCVYGSQTRNVLTVSVIQAASQAQAQAWKQQFLDALRQQAGNQLHVTQVPKLADGGVLARAAGSIHGVNLAVSAVAVLKGTIAFGISDVVVGGEAPSDAALLHEARAVVARLA
jgi:hypothetical protein